MEKAAIGSDLAAMASDRRSSPRKLHMLAGWVHRMQDPDAAMPIRLHDVSERGAAFTAATALRVDELLQLAYHDNGESVRFVCRVVHCNFIHDDTYLVGVEKLAAKR